MNALSVWVCGPFQGYYGLFFYSSRRSLLVSGVCRVVGWCVGSVLDACVFWGGILQICNSFFHLE